MAYDTEQEYIYQFFRGNTDFFSTEFQDVTCGFLCAWIRIYIIASYIIFLHTIQYFIYILYATQKTIRGTVLKYLLGKLIL